MLWHVNGHTGKQSRSWVSGFIHLFISDVVLFLLYEAAIICVFVKDCVSLFYPLSFGIKV